VPTLNDFDIVNWALTLIGAKKIAALSDSSRNARAANQIYNRVRQKLLRKYNWNFAIKQAQPVSEVAITGATAANPVVISVASHPFLNTDRIKISGVLGMTELNDIVYLVSSKTATSFALQDTNGNNVDGTGYTAYSSAGTAAASPLFGRLRYFHLPTDWLRTLPPLPEDNTFQRDWQIEGKKIYTDEGTPLSLRYIYDVTDVDEMDAAFRETLATKLASELAEILTQSNSKKTIAEDAYKEAIKDARESNAFENVPLESPEGEWINQRD